MKKKKQRQCDEAARNRPSRLVNMDDSCSSVTNEKTATHTLFRCSVMACYLGGVYEKNYTREFGCISVTEKKEAVLQAARKKYEKYEACDGRTNEKKMHQFHVHTCTHFTVQVRTNRACPMEYSPETSTD